MTQFIDISINAETLLASKEATRSYDCVIIESWYAQYRQNLLLYVQSIVKDRSVSEELLHECFIKISKMPAIDNIKSPYAFLAKILSNLALDHLRKLGRQPEQESEDILLSIESNDEVHIDVINRSREISDLHSVINHLPARSREVLMLVKFREMTLKDVATELGISQTMVEKHLQRALTKCRIAFSQKGQ